MLFLWNELALKTMRKVLEITPESRVYMGDATALLGELLPSKRVVVISDTNIDRTHKGLIAPFDHILIGQGEQAKSLATLDEVYRRLIDMGADRTTFILGVGGGLVTDVAGFVASTYMRGVEFGFLTTTLLGAVDASIGGKNGVNIGGFKNMVGTFSQPRFVICDVSLFESLPEREFRAGIAEVIKSAIIADKGLFELLETTTLENLRKDRDMLEEVVLRAMRVKADIVSQDEREGGIRRVLNLGHTIAHAIEKSSRKMNHGEAVAVGLYRMVRSAEAQSLLSADDAERIVALLERYEFNLVSPVADKVLLDAMRGDKKRNGDSIHAIYPTAIGSVVDRVVSLDTLP